MLITTFVIPLLSIVKDAAGRTAKEQPDPQLLTRQTSLRAESYNATFDESVTNIAQNLLGIVMQYPLGFYRGLDYNMVCCSIADIVIGIQATTQPNIIGWIPTISAPLNKEVAIRTVKPKAPGDAVAFTISQMDIGCVTFTIVPAVNPAVTCTMDLVGTDSSGNVLASATLRFPGGLTIVDSLLNPTDMVNQLSAPMTTVTLPQNFTENKLDKVSFKLTSSIFSNGVLGGLGTLATAAALDTIQETLWFEE